MARMIHKALLVGLVAGLSASALAQGLGQRPVKPHAARPIMNSARPPAARPMTQDPPQPVVPPRPEQMTPVAPRVTYQNGQLSIVAQNSTLSSILSAVRASTGARVEMPAEAGNERAVAQLGPGSPRDVLAALLQGSRFDYIVMGSPTDPDAISQVILTLHAGSVGAAPAGNQAANQLPQGGNPQPTISRFAGGAARREMNADEDETAAESQPVPQPPPPQLIPPQGVMGADQLGPPNPGFSPGDETGQPQKPNQVKTPEQLLQELQRMQQQQRHQPQQQ